MCALFHIHTSLSNHHFHFHYSSPHLILTTAIKCCLKPKTRTTSTTKHSTTFSAASVPARDKVIDFGKHRGKMLGTLPSSYLKWVSKNLRARDFEDWARLADEVLQDQVYKDRIEWEFAETFLNGNNNNASLRNGSAVSELLEISERFGWDNEDKVGWERLNFELLGTSKTGRIPRIGEKIGGKENRDLKMEENVKVKGEVVMSESGERRRERMLRIKCKKEIGKEEKKMEIAMGKDKVGFESRKKESDNEGMLNMSKLKNFNPNPFPGRKTLLNKVLNTRR